MTYWPLIEDAITLKDRLKMQAVPKNSNFLTPTLYEEEMTLF